MFFTALYTNKDKVWAHRCSWYVFTIFIAAGLQKKKINVTKNVYLSSSSSSSLGQMVEKIERWWAFLDNNLSVRHRCSRSALGGSPLSHGAVLLQLRSVSNSSLNSLTAKLHWTRFRWASSARSPHRRSAGFISAVWGDRNQTHQQNVVFIAENLGLALNAYNKSITGLVNGEEINTPIWGFNIIINLRCLDLKYLETSRSEIATTIFLFFSHIKD